MMTRAPRLLAATAAAVLVGCVRTAPPSVTPAPVVAPVPAPTASPVMAPPTPLLTRPTAGALQLFVDSLVALPQFASAHWGILVVAPERRDTLADVQADRLVMPASNQKLVTASVALAQLGADYRWRTTFIRTGPIRRGVLRGDIVVSGTGDPSVSSAMRRNDPLSAFDPLVSALRDAGVTRIDGRVRAADSSAFPGSGLGFGWDWDDLDTDYGAGITDLMFNEAFTDVTVRGCGSVGSRACVTTAPLPSSPAVHARVRVRGAGTGAPVIRWWRDSATVPGITIEGSIALGDRYEFSASQPDGRGTYVAAVTEALRRAGIQVSGAASRAIGGDTLLVMRSPPLRDILPVMQKPSQNQVAEVLFRTIAREATGIGTPDSARAVIERQLDAWGVRADARAVRDGSGLSRHDYIAPRALVQVLDTMRRRSDFGVFHEALPMPGDEGTLRNRMTALPAGRVRAKTGTIDKARALSGYVTTADGERLIFSIIANNYTVPTREVDRIAELIVARLVDMRRTSP